MEQAILNGIIWCVRTVELLFSSLFKGFQWFHGNMLRLVREYPEQMTVFVEILMLSLLFLFAFTVTRKPKAAAPEASKLAKTDVSWKTDWKALRNVGIGVLVMAVVVGLLSILG